MMSSEHQELYSNSQAWELLGFVMTNYIQMQTKMIVMLHFNG